jgi:hypothetical protein
MPAAPPPSLSPPSSPSQAPEDPPGPGVPHTEPGKTEEEIKVIDVSYKGSPNPGEG